MGTPPTSPGPANWREEGNESRDTYGWESNKNRVLALPNKPAGQWPAHATHGPRHRFGTFLRESDLLP